MKRPVVTVLSAAGIVCGNNIVEAGETCDDGGNANPGDGCDYCRTP